MCRFMLWNCLSFGILSECLWNDGVTHNQRPSVVQMRSGKGDSCHHYCIMYIFTKDLNHDSQATGGGSYVGGACVNSLSYTDDMVLLAPKVCSSDTLGGMSRICWTTWHCIKHNENSMYAGPTKAITGLVLNKNQARKWGIPLFNYFHFLILSTF